jgi:hypothetical protein
MSVMNLRWRSDSKVELTLCWPDGRSFVTVATRNGDHIDIDTPYFPDKGDIDSVEAIRDVTQWLALGACCAQMLVGFDHATLEDLVAGRKMLQIPNPIISITIGVVDAVEDK